MAPLVGSLDGLSVGPKEISVDEPVIPLVGAPIPGPSDGVAFNGVVPVSGPFDGFEVGGATVVPVVKHNRIYSMKIIIMTLLSSFFTY